MRRDADPKHRRIVASVIWRGASLIDRRGWCIGALEDDSGRLCLMGAIQQASQGEPRRVRYDAYDAVNQALRRQNNDIDAWNDQQTSKDPIVALLREVARSVDPAYEPEQVCWHGHVIHPCCQDPTVCSTDYDSCYAGRHNWNCKNHPRNIPPQGKEVNT